MPGSLLRVALREGVVVGLLEVVPESTVLKVARSKLPLFLRIAEPGLEPLSLLLVADVKEALHQRDVPVAEQLFKGVDLGIPFLPDVLGHEFAHANDHHVFIVGTIEDADASMGGYGSMHPPQEVVREFQTARRLEALHIEALRAHTAGKHADRAVLAGGVDPLQDDDDRPLRLREQPVGQFIEFVAVCTGLGLGVGAVEVLVVVGVEIRQSDITSGGYGERLGHERPRKGGRTIYQTTAVVPATRNAPLARRLGDRLRDDGARAPPRRLMLASVFGEPALVEDCFAGCEPQLQRAAVP